MVSASLQLGCTLVSEYTVGGKGVWTLPPDLPSHPLQGCHMATAAWSWVPPAGGESSDVWNLQGGPRCRNPTKGPTCVCTDTNQAAGPQKIPNGPGDTRMAQLSLLGMSPARQAPSPAAGPVRPAATDQQGEPRWPSDLTLTLGFQTQGPFPFKVVVPTLWAVRSELMGSESPDLWECRQLSRDGTSQSPQEPRLPSL